MIDYVALLVQTPNGVLATRDGDSLKTRVFQFLFADGNRVYFCTSSEKPVYAQLQANPAVSFCTYPQNFTPVLSINGRAVFVEDGALKARTLDENPGIKGIYNTPDNPVFKLFYVEVAEVETFSFADGPKTYTL
ncbi:pyridoxamine 5'-phosphate oxidase family protein [Eubacteriales bacterium OttesenSCG-928-A19]|nr:pyridoxamine 5'-phosphate oxidase family protein [Eubacteriales bacterium OttesenSCG-928-A19]